MSAKSALQYSTKGFFSSSIRNSSITNHFGRMSAFLGYLKGISLLPLSANIPIDMEAVELIAQ